MTAPKLILPTHRRRFIKSSAASLAAASCLPKVVSNNIAAAEEQKTSAESLVKVLYDSLTPEQRKQVCYDWDHIDKERGLLRSRVSANWQINDKEINGDFYTAEQRAIIRDVFESMIDEEWHAKFDKQLEDDCGGFGEEQALAIFGQPGSGKFEFVLTGRHMTLRCDGDSAEHVAFGGPIFYGHAPTGGDEEADHSGNVFWNQALEANKVYSMLDGKQRRQAEVPKSPGESRVAFRGQNGTFSGIPITDLASDQKEQMQKVLASLIEPFRGADRQEAMKCLEAQGGLDACYLSFFTDNDIGRDKVWDNWRLEGPAFVWHFRGAPHVHVWVNVAQDPSVELNA
ncbi:MAG: DUF3500 domain-containing protein [bacterium]|nr:DUF3500 domain-containing protein [bacterium]